MPIDVARVEFDPEDFRLVQQLLEGTYEFRRSVYRGLNLGSKRARIYASREIAASTTLKKRSIDPHIKVISKVSDQLLVARLRLRGYPLELTAFDHRAGKKGVSYKIWRAKARERYEHAFKAKLGKHEGIFERKIESSKYDGRAPLRTKYGPSVPAIFDNTPGLAKRALEKAVDEAMTEIDRQMDLVLKGLL
ncbi:MAG: hypothetical protein CMI01_18370 [Oceanospirillaceae bacterium]|nr:hypothetical protein [Oceanospirillaceae bacterium]